MEIISQNSTDKKDSFDAAARFFKDFQIGKLLFKCNAGKEKGVPVMEIFRYLFMLMFSDRSMYMQMHTGTFSQDFCKNTVYRFLNNPRINWERFTTLLSSRIINTFLVPLTSEDRKDVFIIDDSLYDKSRSGKTELLANVFDHCSKKFKRGYRMLTLGWSDGNSFIPINQCLLSAADDRNLLCEAKSCDGRTLAGKRRRQSRRKSTEVMLDLLRSAMAAGISAEYVLFDSWFASPKTIVALKKQLGLDTIALLTLGKAKYGYKGQKLDVKQIYSMSKKRRGRSKYLLSVEVDIEKDGESVPARIVFVRRSSGKKDWLALISTDTSLSEEEIIRIYGKRWDIEVFFKTCKSYLKLSGEVHSLSYDALNAHIAIVFTRYMMLSVTARQNEDPKSLCEILFVLADELKDISFSCSLQIIMAVLAGEIVKYFQISEAQLNEFLKNFANSLPGYIQRALKYKISAV